MSKSGMTMEQMQARLAEIEARNKVLEEKAAKASVLGAIRAAPSKAVRDGEAPASIICIKNVNANPQFPITCHASQFPRLFAPSTVAVLIDDVLTHREKWLYRSETEKASVLASVNEMKVLYAKIGNGA